MAGYGRKLWDNLEIEYDDFVRTTDKNHEEKVQQIFEYLLEKGDIYKGKYVGNYCKSDESYFTDTQLVNGRCPDCGKEVIQMEEESYFFNMKKYQKRLEEYYETHPDFILPHYRKNEILNNFIIPGLEDLSVTRTSFNWGIPVKSDQKHVIYVWLDALTNYITFLGYDVDTDTKKIVKTKNERLYDKFWPANVHIVGKDIIRFHAIYWPIFLMALDIEIPKTIYAHNWFIRKDGKMSKSVGNVVYPEDIKDLLGLDVLRYILLREMPYTHDRNNICR
jgi:tRNA synthetases class I (K)